MASALFVLLALAALRLAWVQHEIDTAPVVPGSMSGSGGTLPGMFGHGTLVAREGFSGWIISDRILPSGKVEKSCTQGVVPTPEADVDFIHVGGAWVKLRTGRATLLGSGELRVEPKTTVWRGVVRSRTAFPVRSPDLPYRAKILYGKLRHGHQSPLDYLRRLKLENPSCALMPTP